MPSARFRQLDVFAAVAGGGNPLGVVLDGAAFTDEQMQRLATWLNLVETTFLLPPSSSAASYRVRIFTPSREIAFAGHPSIGSAHAALDAGIVEPRAGALVQECAAGLLPIRIEDTESARRLFVQSPKATVIERGIGDMRLRDILGLEPLGQLPPALVEGGRRWWVAELAGEAQLRAWRPDHTAIATLARHSNSLGLCVFARSHNADYRLVVRAFPAGVGIVEDPASGAANGLIGAYIAGAEPGGDLAHGYKVSQGREIGRDASIDVRIESHVDVWVGGQTHTVVEGNLRWPPLMTGPGRDSD